jgi:hypothetical protein
MLGVHRCCIISTARPCQIFQISPNLLNQIDGAEVWATDAGCARYEIAVDVSGRGSFDASLIFSGGRHVGVTEARKRFTRAVQFDPSLVVPEGPEKDVHLVFR